MTRWIITHHAAQRYQERFKPSLDREESIAELVEICERSTKFGPSPNGKGYLYVVPGEPAFQLIVVHDFHDRVLTTIWDPREFAARSERWRR